MGRKARGSGAAAQRRSGAAAQRQRFSAIDPDAEDDTPEFAPDLPPEVGSVFQTLDHRKLASAQIEAFEGQSGYQGAAFREVARGLLAARDWKAAAFEAHLVAHAAGMTLVTRGALFDAIVERVLRQLAEHRFMHWPEDADLVLNPMATAMGSYLTEQVTPDPQVGDAADRSLRALYAKWREKHNLAEGDALKSADEWLLAVRRFEDLVGTKPVPAITAKDVRTYRD